MLKRLFSLLRNVEWVVSLSDWLRQQIWWCTLSSIIATGLAKVAQIPWEYWGLGFVAVFCLVMALLEEGRRLRSQVKSPSAIRRARTPKITPRGGEDFALELRYAETASYYGYGWISGKGVTRTRMFHLDWEGEHHKNEGQFATINIAELTG